MRLLADFGLLLLLASTLVRSVARFVCVRAIMARSGQRPRPFEADGSLLRTYREVVGDTPASLVLRISRHGIVLGILLFAVSFAVLL